MRRGGRKSLYGFPSSGINVFISYAYFNGVLLLFVWPPWCQVGDSRPACEGVRKGSPSDQNPLEVKGQLLSLADDEALYCVKQGRDKPCLKSHFSSSSKATETLEHSPASTGVELRWHAAAPQLRPTGGGGGSEGWFNSQRRAATGGRRQRKTLPNQQGASFYFLFFYFIPVG